jgi:hypothetical protein
MRYAATLPPEKDSPRAVAVYAVASSRSASAEKPLATIGYRYLKSRGPGLCGIGTARAVRPRERPFVRGPRLIFVADLAFSAKAVYLYRCPN